jgi:hypothetical protein
MLQRRQQMDRPESNSRHSRVCAQMTAVENGLHAGVPRDMREMPDPATPECITIRAGRKFILGTVRLASPHCARFSASQALKRLWELFQIFPTTTTASGDCAWPRPENR